MSQIRFSKARSRKVLLLLSGGKDSPAALKKLIEAGCEVHGLCIDGIQGQEKVGAQSSARVAGIPLDIVKISFFDENTWNPLRLIARDVAMAVVAIRTAKRVGAGTIATGVKKSDTARPALRWLGPFLTVCGLLAWFFGLRIVHPIWSEDQARGGAIARKNRRRRIKYFLSRLLPRRWRRIIFLRNLRPPTDPSEFTVSIAKTAAEYAQAFDLLREAYAEEGFLRSPATAEQKKMLVFQQIFPSTTLLIAKRGDQVVATMSLYRDNPAALPADQAFSFGPLRARYGVLVEFGALAVHPKFRRKEGKNLVFEVFTYAFHYTKHFLRARAVVLSIYPYHADFYRFIFSCEAVAGQPIVSYYGQPASLLYFDVHRAEIGLRRIGRNFPHLRKFCADLADPSHPNFIWPRNAASVCAVAHAASNYAAEILAQEPQILNEMSARDLAAFCNFFSDDPKLSPYAAEIFARLTWLRKSPRHLVHVGARLGGGAVSFPVTIVEVSESGAKIHLHEALSIEQFGSMRLTLARATGDDVNIRFEPRWHANRFVGLKCKAEDLGRWQSVVRAIFADAFAENFDVSRLA